MWLNTWAAVGKAQQLADAEGAEVAGFAAVVAAVVGSIAAEDAETAVAAEE